MDITTQIRGSAGRIKETATTFIHLHDKAQMCQHSGVSKMLWVINSFRAKTTNSIYMKCTHVLGLEMLYYYIVLNFKLLTQAQPYIQ